MWGRAAAGERGKTGHRRPFADRALLELVTPGGPGAATPDAMALTMTAELSDIFAAKRDGVPVRAWAVVPIEFKLIN